MPSSRKSPARGTREAAADSREAPKRYGASRVCTGCGTPLSAYNAGPYCWRHSLGVPWRGPSGKPKAD